MSEMGDHEYAAFMASIDNPVTDPTEPTLDWDDLSPGDRDALVATEVMGWEEVRLGSTGRAGGVEPGGLYRGPVPVPRFSADIVAAWCVVGKVIADTGLRFQCGYSPNLKGEPRWYAFFGDPADASGSDPDSLPKAICHAALRAKGVDV